MTVNDKSKLNELLLITASRSDYNSVEMLLKNGADVNFCDEYGKTALIKSASTKQGSIITLLLSYGADVNHVDIEYGDTALIEAVKWNKYKNVSILINGGAGLNKINKIGWTALMCAVQRNEVSIIKLLIKNGADVNIKSPDGSALHKCINKEIIKLLIRNGCDVSIVDKNGNTVLDTTSVLYGDYDIQELIFNEQPYNIKLLNDTIGIRDDIKKKYIDLYNAAVVLNVWSIN